MRPADAGPPPRLRLPSLGAGLALWTLAVAGLATWVYVERRAALQEQALATAELRLDAVKTRLELSFGQLAALPRHVAHLDEVQRYLAVTRFPDLPTLDDAERRRLHERLLHDPAMQSMNATLNRMAIDFDLPLTLLVDAHGNAVANGSSARRPETAPAALPYSGNLRDRRYFADALAHGSGAQFVAGRLTRQPGIVFAHRVEHAGRSVGVAAVRQDIDALNRLLPPGDDFRVYVIDRHGVVVLANREAELRRRLPTHDVSLPADWASIYVHEPQPLAWRLSRRRVGARDVLRAEADGRPHLVRSSTLADWPFDVTLLVRDESRAVLAGVAIAAVLAWLAGGLLLWAAWRRLQLVDAALQARRELLQMAQALPLTVFRYRRDPAGGGSFGFVGRGVRELFGIDEQALRDDPQRPWRAAGGGSPEPPDRPVEFRVAAPDGRSRWLLADSTPLPQPDGSVVHTGYWLDVTARREAEARLAAVFEHASDGYLFFSPRRGITHCNPAALRLFGAGDSERLHGRMPWFPPLSPETQPDGRPSRERALELLRAHTSSGERARSSEWRFCRLDGGGFDADTSVIAIDWAGDAEFCVVVRDVTARKQAEAAMQQARAAAEAASRTKTQFLANMSHELRTPMNAIIGMTQLALDDGLAGRRRDYVVKAQRAAHGLMRMLGDILDLAKAEAGELELECVEFDLPALVRDVAAELAGAAAAKGLRLDVELAPALPQRAVGDPVRLRQLLLHLGGNAIKFTERGSVAIGVEAARPDGGDGGLGLHGWVRDTGIGLGDDELARLYQPFVQADASATRRHGGAGLGLVLGRALVALMGGRLWADSAPGRGSTFHFTARLERAAPQAPAAAADAAEADDALRRRLAGRRILLVEDHPLNRELALELLRRAGMDVAVAHDGREALQRLETDGPFDGVLMDCQMPVMDGYTATLELRRRPAWRDLPVIAVTASALASDRERALACGMNAHVGKPLDAALLLRTLAHWVGRADAAAPAEPASDAAAPAPGAPEPAAAGDHLPPTAPAIGDDLPIDRTRGLQHCLGNPAFYRRMLAGFRDTTLGTTAAIQAALARGRAADARRGVHDLKGLAGTIGALALQHDAQALLEALPAEPPAAVQARLAALASRLDAVHAEIARLLAAPDGETRDGETASS